MTKPTQESEYVDYMRQIKISRMINERLGAGRAISAATLALSADCNERAVRTTVNELIEKGALIGSSDNGYYIITSWAEYDRSTGRLENQLKQLSKRLKRLRNNAENKLGNQQTIPGSK